MSDVSVLDSICEELVSRHRVHTVLLYGSRADGTATDDSDFDVAAFGVVADANEIEARGVWAHKMLARMQRADPEGNYRRIWLLQALLEDYFHRRGRWFEGPKKALRSLQASDASAYQAYCRAIEPGASHQAIAALVDLLMGRPAA